MIWLRTLLSAIFGWMARTEAQVAQAESVARVKVLVGYEDPAVEDPLAPAQEIAP